MLRLYVLAEGIAAILLLLGVAFWLGLAIDWLLEPSPLVRGILWGAVLLGTGSVAYRFLFSRMGKSISDTSLALLVERKYPSFDESLVTTVEAGSNVDHELPANPALLRRTSAKAEQGVRNLDLLPIFRPQPLAWKAAGATILWLLIFLLVGSQSEVLAFYLQRLQLSEVLYPRLVQLSVAGFEEIDGRQVARVAKDDSFELEVFASLEDEHEAPERVDLRYRLPDGRGSQDDMIKVGEAIAGRDESQMFRYTLQSVNSDLQLDVVGGDDRIRDLWLQVVERPSVTKIVFDFVYPDYLDLAPQNISATDRIEILEGTFSVCHVSSSKPLQSMSVYDPTNQREIFTKLDSNDPTQAVFELEPSAEDRIFLITLTDLYGVENRDPYRLVAAVVPDSPPEVNVGLSGIGTAITPQANIPWKGVVTDEYGLQDIWYETQIGATAPDRWSVAGEFRGKQKFDRLPSLDLAEVDGATNRPRIDLKPGEQLALSAQASDFYDLQNQAHVGRSQRYLLDVVTESELRSLLEKRELTLRQRFESIFEKMVATRELLDRIEIGKYDSMLQAEAVRAIQRDRLRVGGCGQNAAQLSHETLSVAEGFEGIVTELVNNRIDTEELKQRLAVNIAEPLREISEDLLPSFEETTKLLETTYVDKPEVNSGQQELYQRAVLESDEIVDSMKRVLDRMLELESYNELVALLRSIVGEQKQLHDQTKEKRRAKLLDILGE